MEKEYKIKPWQIFALVIGLCVIAGFIIRWLSRQRRRLYCEWREKLREVRDLRTQIRVLQERKMKLEKYARRTLFVLKLALVAGVTGAAYWLQQEFTWNIANALLTAGGIARLVYWVVTFLFAKKVYQVNEALEIAEAQLIKLYEQAGGMTAEHFLRIEARIACRLEEALLIKQQLRPEAQVKK